MHTFNVIVEKFKQKGEKTSWTHIIISEEDAQKIKPKNKKSFRVKGFINDVEVAGIALMPMGGGEFVFPLNAEIRKKTKVQEGDEVLLRLEEDVHFKIEMPEDLQEILEMENVLENFMSLSTSHRNYFIKYIDSAKTTATRVKRLEMTLNAMIKGWDYGQMIRNSKA